MAKPTLTTLRSVLLLAALVLMSAGCVYGPPHAGPPPAYGAYYYDYYYYPHADVYFQIYTGEYYFRAGSAWHRSRVLPTTIYLDPRDRHELHIRDDKPYVRDREYRQSIKPAPGYRYEPNRAQDRDARRYNERRTEEYRKKYGR